MQSARIVLKEKEQKRNICKQALRWSIGGEIEKEMIRPRLRLRLRQRYVERAALLVRCSEVEVEGDMIQIHLCQDMTQQNRFEQDRT